MLTCSRLCGAMPRLRGYMANYPTIFTDGAWSVSAAPGHVKIVFYRNDPALPDEPPPTGSHTAAQLVMPYAEFASMAIFFEQQLKTF